jgi:hypothetical protein
MAGEIPLGDRISVGFPKDKTVEQTPIVLITSLGLATIDVTIAYTDGKSTFQSTLLLPAASGAKRFNQPTQNAKEMLIKGDNDDVLLKQLCEGPDPR